MLAPRSDPARAAPGFVEATGGALLVGRVLTFRGLGEDLLAAWDRWEGVAGDAVSIVPAHDLSRFEEYAGFRGWFRVAIGVSVTMAYADGGPSAALDHRAIVDAAARAREHLDGARIDALGRGLHPEDARSLAAQRTRALLVPFGPIASAHLAYGVLAPALGLPPAGRARVRGADMQERPHAQAIHGLVIASACDWDVAQPDVSEGAHAARAFPGAAYHVVTRYG